MTPCTPLRCLTALAALLVIHLAASPSLAEDPAELLRKLQERRDEVRALRHVTTTVHRDGDVVKEVKTKTWEQRTDKTVKRRVLTTTTTRQEGKDAGKAAEVHSLTVSDGKAEWRELPMGDGKLVVKSKPVKTDPFKEIRDAVRADNARIRGRERINDERCVVIETIGKVRKERFKATYWICERAGLILKTDIKRPNRSSSEMTTEELEIDGRIKEKRFAYTPPAGATVVDTDAIGKRAGGSAP
jgi:outer membrane lipoprotein-sorting protein